MCIYGGILLGNFMYFFFPLRKKVALINLKIAFPKKSSYELKEILKKCYIHFGILASDFFRLPKLKKQNIHQIINLDQKSKKILDSNHAIIMSAHLGNWELIIPMMGYNNYKMAVVTQTQKNKSGEKFFNWIIKNNK